MEARARAVLDRIPPAIDGDGGSKTTLWAARCLTRGLLLSEADSLSLLLRYYNPRCLGPWSEAELARKVSQAATLPFGKADGWLLSDRPRPSAAGPSDASSSGPAAEDEADDPLRAALDAAAEARERLAPTRGCPTPRPVVGRHRSTGMRCAAPFPCDSAARCRVCRVRRYYETYRASESYLLRTSLPDPAAMPDGPRVLAAAIVSGPLSPTAMRALRRAGGDYQTIPTAGPAGCANLIGLPPDPSACLSDFFPRGEVPSADASSDLSEKRKRRRGRRLRFRL